MIVPKLKNKFIAPIGLAFILLILISSHTFSQSNLSLTGQVLDAENGFPLSDVAVQVVTTPYGAFTNEDGFFFIENIPPGTYTVQFSFLGYETKEISNVTVGEDFPTGLMSHLTPKPLLADSVVVISETMEAEFGLEGEKTVLSKAVLDRYGQLGIPQLLQQVAGVQVESAGSGGTRTTVRIHGGRTSQVLVLLDGQRLNNPQTGEVDLSEIPLKQVERIEIIRQGNSALFGSNAYDGIIEFHTRQTPRTNHYSLQSKAGSFSTIMGSFSAGLNVSGVGGLFSYQQDYSRQDFDYEYEDNTFTRDNAWYRTRKAFGKIGYKSSRCHLRMLYNRREGDRGLPCSFFNECGELSAKLHEKAQVLQANQRWIFSSKGYLEGIVAYHHLFQRYDNKDDPVRINRYQTEQTNQTVEASLTGKFSVGNLSELRMGVNYLNESMDQENLLYPQFSIGEKNRESRAVFGGLEMKLPQFRSLWHVAKISSSVRYEKYFSQSAHWYPNLGLSLVPSIWKALNISSSWYKAVRYPDFNSLFWKGDTRARGNPELLPERKTAWNISLRMKYDRWYLPKVNLHYYSERIADLIFWHRSFNGVWEPRNEDKAEKRGVDLELRQNLLPDYLQIQTAYSWIEAVNKVDEPNRYDKNIIFIPQHTLNTSLWIGWGNWQAQVVYRFVSERETVPANSNGTQLPPYEIWHISGGYKHQFGKFTIDIGLTLKNLTGTEYQLLYGYPMPGREIQLNLSINFQTQ